MTYALSLKDQDGSIVVDLMAVNANVTFNVTNPIIDIPTPAAEVTETGLPEFNVYTINIGFLRSTININFKEAGGFGSVFNTTRTTYFEKLYYLSNYVKGYKLLYVDHASGIPVQIMGYRANVAPGAKDIVDHTLTLLIGNTESE